MEDTAKKEIPEDKDNDKSTSKTKLRLPKRKYAIIHGYNGHQFSGNQKNPDVRTVEDELERVLYKLDFISQCNYGFLQKISWMRASRTDKGVSAVMNVVSCKLHKHPNIDEDLMKEKVNDLLPKDIKVFRFIEVSDSFDSKDNNNYREYHYILPSFMLEPKPDNVASIVSCDEYKGNYEFTISPEYHDKIKEVCKTFKGSRKYHNYTKKVAFSDPQSVRHIYEFSCDTIIQFENSKLEGILFKITGQSFLYNQIRKMIGCIIDACRENRSKEYMENSFLANKMEIPKAPAEGLYLHKIDYSKYNDRKTAKKNNIFITEEDEKQMEDFRLALVSDTEKKEINEKVFSKWQWRFDNMRENIY